MVNSQLSHCSLTALPVEDQVPDPRSTVAPPLCVYLLGRFEVWRQGELGPVTAWRRPKVAALFKWLCLQGGRRVCREEALEALWGDLRWERALRNLATTLSTLRGALGATATVCLRTDAETLQLVVGDAVWIDTAAFEQHVVAAARCRRAGDAEGTAHHCRAALALYEGELLSGDPLAEWMRPERQRLAALRLRALVTLAEHALAHDNPLDAEALTLQALQQDPCEESAVRTRMETLVRQGKRTEALRCFEQFRRELRRELNAEPEAETLALCHRLRLASPNQAANTPLTPR
jgi:DNA-binding SARP family transcriptional activator